MFRRVFGTVAALLTITQSIAVARPAPAPASTFAPILPPPAAPVSARGGITPGVTINNSYGNLLTYPANSRDLGFCSLLTLGDCIDKLKDDINKVISQAEMSGQALEVQAGNQVLNSLDAMQIAFAVSLNVQMSQVNSDISNIVGSTIDQVSALEQQSYTDIQAILDQTNDTLQQIPFVSHVPVVRRLNTSLFIGPTSEADIDPSQPNLIVDISGDFADVGTGKNATLRLVNPDKTYGPYIEAHVPDSHQLSFAVPLKSLIRDPNGSTKSQYVHFELAIPYKNSGVCLFNCWHYRTFTPELVSVPMRLGEIHVDYSSVGQTTAYQHRVGGQIRQDSSSDDITEGDKRGALYCTNPDPGWQVIAASAQGHIDQVVEGNQGSDWWWTGNPSGETGPASACLRMETIHHIWGSSGKVIFHMEFDEQQPQAVPLSRTEDHDLTWGQPVVASLRSGESWRGTFTSFDGKVYQFATAQTGTPYLKVTSLAGGIQFTPLSVLSAVTGP